LNLVVDASVAIKWFVEEESHDEAIALANESNHLIAPDIIFSEVANVLRRKVRLDYISHEQAAFALRSLPDAFKDIISSSAVVGEAFENASVLNHSVYDIVYLVCALREPGSLLVTADGKFEAKAVAAGFGNKVVSVEVAYARFLKAQENENG
jgi:hypothetical protein